MKNQLGVYGEKCISKFLEKRGFNVIEKNYNCRYGEIDLVAEKDETLAFVEVKSRKKEHFPISTVVIQSKQQKIIKSAKHFVFKKQILDKILRFDVATVVFDENRYKINYIENAFYGNWIYE